MVCDVRVHKDSFERIESSWIIFIVEIHFYRARYDMIAWAEYVCMRVCVCWFVCMHYPVSIVLSMLYSLNSFLLLFLPAVLMEQLNVVTPPL